MFIVRPVGLSLVSSTVPENDAPAWDVATAYTIGSSVIRAGSVYVSTIENNLGFDPANEVQELQGARWVLKGPINRLAFLDDVLSTSTTSAATIVLEAEVDGAFDTVAVFGLGASRCLVEVLVNGVVRGSREILTGAAPVSNWWSWLHTEFYKFGERYVLRGMNGLSGAVVRLTIDGPAPALGLLSVGRSIHIGDTRQNANTNTRRRTFTEVKTNEFGVTKVTKRPSARDVVYSITAKREGFERIERFLDQVVGVPVVTFAHDDRLELINYGIIVGFDLPQGLPDHYQFKIKVQGVT